MLILRFTNREVRLGGAANAAHNVHALGAEALAVARSRPAPDTVLLDVALPDLSGVEVARALRSQAWAARTGDGSLADLADEPHG